MKRKITFLNVWDAVSVASFFLFVSATFLYFYLSKVDYCGSYGLSGFFSLNCHNVFLSFVLSTFSAFGIIHAVAFGLMVNILLAVVCIFLYMSYLFLAFRGLGILFLSIIKLVSRILFRNRHAKYNWNETVNENVTN
ncbi:hypothetical protein A11S_1046 [Micavibrio aeruginosavorus EPB]|uniref:Uncharacterized protein n=1 Tax=Micavibrio aeruginosavorus EPB TaxID=349215 RepID=M4VXE6_9BACT|nr:hypothetical protein A11S_1046 [Micavibrio aeruginosavorus EPB]